MSLPDELLLSLVKVVSGEDGVKVAKFLGKKPEATDDEIATETEIPINEVRKILYNLYNSSLTTYRKTRDMKTGWFIYHWKLQPARAKSFMRSQRIRILKRLRSRLDYEQSHDFYFCSNPKCPEMLFEEAISLSFRCPTCKKKLKPYNTNKLIDALDEKIKRLKDEMSSGWAMGRAGLEPATSRTSTE